MGMLLYFLLIIATICLKNGIAEETVTATGNLVDHYCWYNLNGRALDTGANLTVDPHQHTVHCLVEVPICKNSGFSLVPVRTDNGREPLDILYQLDEVGNSLAIEDMLKLPTTNGQRPQKNYTITLEGVVDSSISPPLLKVSRVVSNGPTPSTASHIASHLVISLLFSIILF